MYPKIGEGDQALRRKTETAEARHIASESTHIGDATLEELTLEAGVVVVVTVVAGADVVSPEPELPESANSTPPSALFLHLVPRSWALDGIQLVPEMRCEAMKVSICAGVAP